MIAIGCTVALYAICALANYFLMQVLLHKRNATTGSPYTIGDRRLCWTSAVFSFVVTIPLLLDYFEAWEWLADKMDDDTPL